MSKRRVTSKRRTTAPVADPPAQPPAPMRGPTPAPTPAQPPAPTRGRKRPFDLDDLFARLRDAVKPYKKAAMFELAERGYDSVFHVLVGCIVSIRTLDEVSLPTSLNLFEHAPTPEAIAKLTPRQIDRLIRACTFHEPKSKTIHAIARRTVEEFGGTLPCDFDVLRSFHGVGPKCANLALGITCGKSADVGISVDIHVHRVTNRWGLVQTRTPEQTMKALHAILPQKYWIEINALLVPFGKHICTGVLPKCSTCPLLEYCRQVGVSKHR